MSYCENKTSCSNKIKIMVASIIVVTAGIASSLFFGNKTTQLTPDKFHGTLLQTPRSISDFSLNDHHNQPYTQKNLKDKWTFVFFGFTDCPAVCPTAMANLNKFYKLLEQRHANKMPQIVLISIDPERDTAEKLKKYVTAFNPNFIGVTGKQAALDLLTRELGIAYAKVINKKDNDAMDYTMEHSGAIILFDPQGKVREFFTEPHDASKMAEDYLLLSAN